MKKKGKKTNTFFKVRVLDDYDKFTVNVLKCYALDTSSMNLTTLRAVVSPGRTLRERNHCEQPFDFPSSMRLHVTPTSNDK